MKNSLKNLTNYFGLYEYWKDKVSKLEKKDNHIIISDLDDCLYSRTEQLQGSELLKNNRGNKGTELIINEIGLKNYIDEWFKGRKATEEITSKLDTETDVILTAGILEAQIEKVKALGLEKYKMIVVESGKEKIIATIRYIIFDLGYIPSSITVYEDRPEYFVEYRELLEDILSTKIIIKKVVLKGDNGATQINKI